MLIGEHIHVIDGKKRLSLPAKFRKELGKKIVVTTGLDKCLFVYTQAQWKKMAEQLANLSVGKTDTRSFNRFLLGGAVEVDVDALGRILIPEFQKEFAGLKAKVVIVGMYSRLEIWNDKAWNECKSRIGNEADVVAEKLGELGAL